MSKGIVILFLCLTLNVAFSADLGDGIFKKVDPVLVAIQHERASGSGFIISEDGYILTNGHVVSLMDPENPKETAKRITVVLHDEKKYQADVIGFSLDPDVALLKIEPKEKLAVAEIADSEKVKPGQTCYAFGAPLGLKKTLTKGIISNNAQTSLGTYTKVFQMDAVINPGNSGGPLFNEKGKVIAMNTYGGRAGIGFSIPINVATLMVDHFKKHGRFIRTELSFFLAKIMSEEFAKTLNAPKGLFIDYVMEDTAMAALGLRAEDIITEFEGKKININTDSEFMDLAWEISTRDVGSKVSMTIVRRNDLGDWQPHQFHTVLTEEEPLPAYDYQIGELEEVQYSDFGLGVQRLTRYGAIIYGLDYTSGVRVNSIKRSSAAAKAGLRNNDMIYRVNNKLIKNEQDFKRLVDYELKNHKKYLIFDVYRGNDRKKLVVRIPYRLRSRKLLILAIEDDEYLETIKRLIELKGAHLTVKKTTVGLKVEDYQSAIILNDNPEAIGRDFLDALAEKEAPIGILRNAALHIFDGPKKYSEKKMTMSKDISARAVKKKINYTGKENESDGLLVSSTAFDRKTVKDFVSLYTNLVARKTLAE